MQPRPRNFEPHSPQTASSPRMPYRGCPTHAQMPATLARDGHSRAPLEEVSTLQRKPVRQMYNDPGIHFLIHL